MKTIYIIGIGMGNADTLTLGAIKRIEKSHGLIGAKRMLDSFPDVAAEKHAAIAPDAIMAWIRDKMRMENGFDTVSVLMSGDSGFFSGAKKLLTLIEAENTWLSDRDEAAEEYCVEVIAGISSLQYFCAALGISWDDANIVSLHGRAGNPAAAVQTHAKTFFLTGGDFPPQEIFRRLAEAGLGHVKAFVGERLSYEDQKITSGGPVQLMNESYDSLSVVLVENPRPVQPASASQGLPDDCFIRGRVPMTKSEVRAVTLARLSLKRNDVIYDIGAGTGSVAVEMALSAPEGQTYAIEINEEGLALIQANREKFAAWNLQPVAGLAPEAMTPLPAPDKAFIGGSKGNMKAILESLCMKNPKVEVVVNAIALESMWEAMTSLTELGFCDVEVTQLSAARGRKAGKYHMMTGENPIFIISGKGPAADSAARFLAAETAPEVAKESAAKGGERL